MIDLTEIIIAIIGLLFAAANVYLIPMLKQKLGAEKYSEIQTWVNIAVKAAEMLYVGSGRGEEKKAYVLEFLNNKGITLDTESIDNMIEAAVLDLQNSMAE